MGVVAATDDARLEAETDVLRCLSAALRASALPDDAKANANAKADAPPPSTSGARKLTVVVTLADVQVLVEPLKPRAQGDAAAGDPVKVKWGGPPRKDPTTKNLAYVGERKAFVDPTLEETLLVDPITNEILEGSQTNFFVVCADGKTVQTAGKGVLEGTVRAAVLAACADLHIPVCLDAPRTTDLSTWREAFLASTSRLVMPIDELESRAMPASRPVSEAISAWVVDHVDKLSRDPDEVLKLRGCLL